MAVETDCGTARLVHQRLFATVARSIVGQLAAGGFHWSEILELANDLLEEVLQLRSCGQSGSDAGSVPSPAASREFRPAIDEATLLRSTGRADLGNGAYVRWFRPDDDEDVSRWQLDAMIRQSLAIEALQHILCTPSTWTALTEQYLTICESRQCRPIGLVGLVNIDRKNGQGQLVKMIGEPAQRGRGYARSATRILLTYAFRYLYLERVCLRTTGANLKNISLNESLGFHFEGLERQAVVIEGVRRDVVTMSMLRSDLRADCRRLLSDAQIAP